MDKEQIKELADFIFESEENVTFPLLLAKINMMGVEVKGEEDFTSGCIKNCIYWKGISKEAIEVLRDIEKFYNVMLQPYGFDQEGVKLYKSWYPDMPIFNHLLIDKMTPKHKKEFMAVPYMMPVYWVPASKAKKIRRPN